MYRWLECYERKHVEFWRVINRFRRDSTVWSGRADRHEKREGSFTGAVNFARTQAAMYKRLEGNAMVTFKDANSGARLDLVSSTSFSELVSKIKNWRDNVFK